MSVGAGEPTYDVAILGGGLAGNLLARQLVRAMPELRVGLFERETQTAYKVGEATVEIQANYLTRRLGLTSYLYEYHLPKNGLRYFFDDEQRNLELEQMSEIGTVNLPFHPAFQLDRAALEADLLAGNRAAGVELRTGTAVTDVRTGRGGAPHRFTAAGPDGGGECSARWLVDAGGRAGHLARIHELREPVPQHQLGSVWGRFENVVDIDAFGSEAFRARVRHTARRLSTLHFMYRGYWAWFIPLRGGLTSIGVTGACVRDDASLRTPEGFQAFLRGHRGMGELLEGASLVDIGSYRSIAYGTKRVFDADRWALVGEAATSLDPLYSPGGDFIALENDMLCDLVARDRAGEEIGDRLRLYDEFVRFRHRAALHLYTDQYDTLGSFELTRLKWAFDIGCYYNLWVQSYFRDEHLSVRALRRQLAMAPVIEGVMANFAKLFRRCAAELEAGGRYHAANRGRFLYGLEDIDFAEAVGVERSEAEVMETTLAVFNRVRALALALLGKVDDPAAVEPVELAAFLPDRELP